jgi:hypothetical protein
VEIAERRRAMANSEQQRIGISWFNLRAATVGPALAIMFVLTVLATQAAQAQTFNVLHNFTGGADGANPLAGLTMDKAGNLYGTAFDGGNTNNGAVFKLISKGSGWVFNPLYDFAGGSDASGPAVGVIVGPNGSLYGTTTGGGAPACQFRQSSGFIDCGTVFAVKPQVTACTSALCFWADAVLYGFSGGADGGFPGGELVVDDAGDLYGMATLGGQIGGSCLTYGCGTIYKLTLSKGVWTESTIYTFSGGNDGVWPSGGLVIGPDGNLYGTTEAGGGGPCETGPPPDVDGCGTVFQLTPSGSGWTEKVLYSFQGGSDGQTPAAGLIFDGAGNLYGTTYFGDNNNNAGTVFELTPSNGNWIYTLVYTLGGSDTGGSGCAGNGGPAADLVMDRAGNLYGTMDTYGAYGYGAVFKLTPSNDSWVYQSLHDFTGGSDGGYSCSNLVFDTNGNLYGTTFAGGTTELNCAKRVGYECGVVFKITPN